MRTIKCRQSTNQMRECGKIWIMSCAQCRQWSFQKSPSCVCSAPTAVEPSVRFVCSIPTYSNVWMVDEWCLFTPLACFLASHLRLLALPNGHMAVYGVVSTANSANGWLGCHASLPIRFSPYIFNAAYAYWCYERSMHLSHWVVHWVTGPMRTYISPLPLQPPHTFCLRLLLLLAACFSIQFLHCREFVFAVSCFFAFALFYLLLSMSFFNIEINLLTNSYSTCST